MGEQQSTGREQGAGPLVIAIDGPAGSGKSTLARRMARALGLPYVNTGLMYRALARRSVDLGIEPDDATGLASVLPQLRFDIEGTDPPELTFDGTPDPPALRSPSVEAVVSAVARHPEVRSWMREAQRSLGAEGAVMEGRDIGTVVFPDAPVKLFLSARLDVRAGRRALESADGAPVSEVGRAVETRDRADSKTNPLEAAPDAVVLDSSGLSPDQVFEEAMVIAAASRVAPAAGPASSGRRLPRVALVGRQNVGKSTLLNRLHGRKVAISHEMPGVTRDRLEVPAEWEGVPFTLVDTGGFAHGARGIEVSVATQAQRAADEADLVVLVVDGSTGVQEEDATLARRLLRTGSPAMLVANKIDSDRQESLLGEFAALGLGQAMAVSALHGRGAGEVLDEIVARLEVDAAADDARGEAGDSEAAPQLEGEHRFVIVGKPNVGKSSLFNRLLSDERSVVHDEPGTTRDAIDSIIEVDGRTVRFVDTAGLRRRTKTQAVEFYGVLRTERAIESAQVALLVMDATAGLTAEDKRIAADVAEMGRGLVIVLNKWDLIDPDERDHLFKFLRKELQTFPGTPVLRTSAVRGTGVHHVLPALEAIRASWGRRVSTAEVNRVVEALTARHPPPRGVGRIRYATQVSAGPPMFVAFGIGDPGPAYRRYLENALRREFGFDGVPVRISFRARERRTAGPNRGGHARRDG